MWLTNLKPTGIGDPKAAENRRFFDGLPKIELHKKHIERQFTFHARTENAWAALPEASISPSAGLIL
jgi:hypothetical protein